MYRRLINRHTKENLDSNIIPIFIGGFGRTGSTVIKRLLGSHDSLFALRWESKFISHESYGLMDIVEHATREQLEDFDRRMHDFAEIQYPEYLCDVIDNWGYRAHNGSTVKLKKYERELDRLEKSLMDNSLDRDVRMQSVNRFVHYLFDRYAIAADCKGWVEQTPRNMDWAPEFLECFSNALFVYSYRDPRDVISSLLPLWWGPSSIEEAITYCKERYATWKRSEARIKQNQLQDRLVSLRFEDEVRTQGETGIANIFQKLGMQNKAVHFDTEKAHIGRWKTDLAPQDIELIENELTEVIEGQGYE